MIASLRARLVAGVLVAGRGRACCVARRRHLRRAALVPARPRRPAGCAPRRAASLEHAARRPTRRRRRAAATRAATATAAAARRRQPAARAPTASCATATGTVGAARRVSYGQDDDRRRARAPARASPIGQAGHGRLDGRHGLRYRVARAARRRRRRHDRRRDPADATSTRRSTGCCSSRALVIAGVLLALGALRAGGSCASACARSTAWATTAGAIAAGDLSQPRRARRRSAPRSAASGSRSTRCSTRLEDAFAEREASEDRLRRFLADASHELRTPLASIRGYAELFRMGAAREPGGRREGDAPDRGRGGAHGRARRGPAHARAPRRGAATPRARARRPRRARRATPSTTRARPRPTARSRSTPRRRRACTGDADQLRQVLANLLRNALVHTPAGTPIEVAVDATDGDVGSRCATTAPACPTDDPDALFERFWRAEGGRERGKGGAGLGLAIVAGIVDAHGGTVDGGQRARRRRALRGAAPPPPTPRKSSGWTQQRPHPAARSSVA